VPSKLLRRSISYESFDEDGLLFLASAGTATALQDALKGFQDERLQQFVEQHEGGIYVVPPSSSWLLESKEVEAFGARRPPIEEIFYPKFPLVLYEVTPKTLKFFKRVFHAHKDHFDDRGELRADLKLLTKGLAKLLYGAAIPSNSPLFDFLEHAFAPDSSARVVREIESNPRQKAANQMVPGSFVKDLEGLSKARLKHDVARQAAFRHGKAKKEGADEVTKLDKSFDEEVREQRTRLRNQLAQAPLVKKAYGAPEWLDKSGVELLGEMIVNDAETMSGRLPAEKDELETLVDLCEEAAAEARAINDFVGYYMTFVC